MAAWNNHDDSILIKTYATLGLSFYLSFYHTSRTDLLYVSSSNVLRLDGITTPTLPILHTLF